MATERSMYDRNVAAMERIIGYGFNDKTLCLQAMQMAETPSAYLPFNGGYRSIRHNTRLAVLGDSVLAQTLCKMWFNATDEHGFPAPKSTWDNIRQDMIGNASLHQRGVQLGMEKLILSNPGTIRPSAKMVASTFQAVFGAIYMDGGEAAVTAAVEHMGIADHPSLQTDTRPH